MNNLKGFRISLEETVQWNPITKVKQIILNYSKKQMYSFDFIILRRFKTICEGLAKILKLAGQ